MTLNKGLGQFLLALSAAGFPLTQAVIARFGRRGAVGVEAVVLGLLARNAALLATGTPGPPAPVPAALLWAETAAAIAATATGAVLLLDPEVASARDRGWRVSRRELARRLAVGLLFGLHTWRFRIFLEPDSGRREDASPPDDPGAAPTPAAVAEGW